MSMNTATRHVSRLISTAYDLGQQQASFDADDNGLRSLDDIIPRAELCAWRRSGREANDQGVIDAVDRYLGYGGRTRARIDQAYLDGYATAVRTSLPHGNEDDYCQAD